MSNVHWRVPVDGVSMHWRIVLVTRQSGLRHAFKRQWKLLGNFFLFFFSNRVWFPSLVLSGRIFFEQMSRTRSIVVGGRREVIPEKVIEAPTKGRGRAWTRGHARGVAPAVGHTHGEIPLRSPAKKAFHHRRLVLERIGFLYCMYPHIRFRIPYWEC